MALLRRAKDPFKQIQTCLQKRDYKGALGWFKPLLEKDTKNTQVRLRYADTLVLAGSRKEAIRQYRVVADELADAGFMIRAIAINKKIVQLDPAQSEVHAKLAAMNEERSMSLGRRSSTPVGVSLPPPRRDEIPTEIVEEPPSIDMEIVEEPIPSVGEPRAPEGAVEPGLSLEESMVMEFGDTSREAPAATRREAAEPEPTPADEAAEIQFEDIGGPEVSVGRGVEDIEAFEEVSVGPEQLDERAPQSSREGPTFGTAEEELAFSEEAVELSEADLEEVEEHEEAFELEEEPAEEAAPGMEIESEEMGWEIETEKAADGSNPLVGLLGEDIDALIDSIIDDVGSSAVRKPPAPPARQATRIPLFSDLTAEEFVDVAIMLVRRAEKAGTVIVREGDPGESMFIVSTGLVEATRMQGGRRIKLATLRDGDFFGEMAVLSGEPRSATVATVKNTELLELNRKDLQEICSRHPEVEAKLRMAHEERRARTY